MWFAIVPGLNVCAADAAVSAFSHGRSMHDPGKDNSYSEGEITNASEETVINLKPLSFIMKLTWSL